MRDIKDILKAWANTRVMKRMGTEFPAQAACMNGAPRSFDYRQYLTENEADIVDKAILLLKGDNELQHTVLISCYLKNMSCNYQAKLTGKDKAVIYTALSNAEAFIRGNVIEFFKTAA